MAVYIKYAQQFWNIVVFVTNNINENDYYY